MSATLIERGVVDMTYSGQNNRIRKPRFSLNFLTENTQYHILPPGETPKTQSGHYYTTESVLSLTTSNALSDDTGAFSFVIVGVEEWDKKLNSNDMVELYIEPREMIPQWDGWTPTTPGGIKRATQERVKNSCILVGLIAEVKREADYQEGMVMYRITGQSYAKALMQFELRPIKQTTLFTEKIGWLGMTEDGGINLFQGKTAAENVKNALKRFGPYIKFNFESGSREIISKITQDFSSWDDEALGDSSPYINFEGSLNQMLINLVNKPFNEMFFDIDTEGVGSGKAGKSKVRMTVRRTPFDKEDWKALTQHKITSSDVLVEELSQHDLDAYSIFSCMPATLLGVDVNLYAKPRYSPRLVEKYGYRLLEVENKYLSLIDDRTKTDTGSLLDNKGIKKYAKKLYNWYANNPNFFSGDIKILGNPDIRLGNRLYYENKEDKRNWEFYIESVSHNFSYKDGFTTNIGVTRGLKVTNPNGEGGRFKLPMGSSKEFEGGLLGEPTMAEIEEFQKRLAEAEKANQNTGAGSSGSVNFTGSGTGGKVAQYALTYAENGQGQTYYSLGGGHGSTNVLKGARPILVDCSGFTYWCYKEFGVDLAVGGNRSTFAIRNHVGFDTIGNIGSNIDPKKYLQPGDLVFFNGDSHVGIYVGNGDFVGSNGDSPYGGVDYSGGIKKRSMYGAYWKDVWEGHAMRLKQRGSGGSGGGTGGGAF